MFDIRLQSYINNSFINSSGKELDNINPSDGKILNSFNENSLKEVDDAIHSARQAQKLWEKIPAIERAVYLKKIGDKIKDKASKIVNIIVQEQGKIKSLAEGEVNNTA